MGFKDLFVISNAMFAKLWWILRTTRYLWSNYIWNKYGKKLISTVVQWKNGPKSVEENSRDKG